MRLEKKKMGKEVAVMGTILFMIYFIAGYWATGKTIYANKIIIYSGNTFFVRRMTYGMLFGFILIPWALIKVFLNR